MREIFQAMKDYPDQVVVLLVLTYFIVESITKNQKQKP